MFKKLVCLMIVMVFSGAAQALIFEDNFDFLMDSGWGNRADYQAWYMNVLGLPYPGNDAGASIGAWDGYMSILGAGGVPHTIAASNYVPTWPQGDGEDPDNRFWRPGMPEEPRANGVLRMISKGGGFENIDNQGAFLFKMVEGDFVAEVEIVGGDNMFHNLGGIMARKPNEMFEVDGKYTAVSGAGTNENWVSLCYFPLWDVGARGNDTVNGVTTWVNPTGYPAATYLQVSRSGNTFTLSVKYTAEEAWTAIGSVVRDDLPSLLQVGPYKSSFDAAWQSTIYYDNFSIIPEPATIALLGLGGLVLLRRKRA